MVAGVFATTPMAAYAEDDGDSSETKTKQEIKQKNEGSGESTNVNCADNDIGGATEDGLIPPIDVQLCGTGSSRPRCSGRNSRLTPRLATTH